MGQEKNNNQSVVITIILCLLVLVLGGYIVYDKFLSTKDEEIDNNIITETSYTISTIAGLYEYKGDSTGENTARIYLADDGTFMYWLPYPTPYGFAGNYYIEANTIILNASFQVSGGMSIQPLDEEKINNQNIDKNHKMTIDENGNLSESVAMTNETQAITGYTKKSADEATSYLNSNGSFEKWLTEGYYKNSKAQ